MPKSELDFLIEDLGEMVTILSSPAPVGSVFVCSGGVADNSDAPPALFLTRQAAMASWMDSMREWVWEHRIKNSVWLGDSAVRWAEKPGIYRYAITMQHENGHRVAEERFAVVCRVWIGTIEDGQKLPPEKADMSKDVER